MVPAVSPPQTVAPCTCARSPHAPHVDHGQNTTGPSYLRASPPTSGRIARPVGLRASNRTRSVQTTGAEWADYGRDSAPVALSRRDKLPHRSRSQPAYRLNDTATPTACVRRSRTSDGRVCVPSKKSHSLSLSIPDSSAMTRIGRELA